MPASRVKKKSQMTVKSLWDRIEVFMNFNGCYLSEICKAPCFFKRTLP